ncbi:MAG: glycoside hydrolase family 43 protein [Bacteroidaceae bacterium]|nr:glycoside hydrolase family 43 protein [Bacteroidaceae bacterium]
MKNSSKRLVSFAFLALCALASFGAKPKYVAYLFSYFTGNDPEQEQICYALSDDGWNYTPLNDGLPVISSDTIALKKAVRDPHILRGEDGYFYQVITDMASSQGWSSNRGMVLMRSRDLISWEHHAIHFPDRYKGTMFEHVLRVWAPQTVYDKEAGKYMVYFSILTDDGSCPYDRVYYCYANADFSDFEGEPQLLFDVNYAAIDTDIVCDDEGIYHIFFKTEGQHQKGVKQFLAKTLHNSADWELLPGFCQDTNEAVEGSGVFRLFDGTWVLMYDCYMNGHYQFCKSTDLRTFKKVQNTKTSGKFTPRHGTVIAITQEELNILRSWENLQKTRRSLRTRAVPTLTLYQLDNREQMLQRIDEVLNGPASLKTYKALEKEIANYFKK